MQTDSKYKVLLVDDSEADNFLHRRIIRKSGKAASIDVANNGFEALTYLSTPTGGDYPRPDIILLDINMPGMNGWEFLDRYLQLEPAKQARTVICMLTASNVDQQKLAQFGVVDGHIDKPLTAEKFSAIVALVEG